jgi:hypothetical protein
MFCNPSTENLLQHTLDTTALREIVVDLDDINEELLSGGVKDDLSINKPNRLIVALVLLFANPFS